MCVFLCFTVTDAALCSLALGWIRVDRRAIRLRSINGDDLDLMKMKKSERKRRKKKRTTVLLRSLPALLFFLLPLLVAGK